MTDHDAPAVVHKATRLARGAIGRGRVAYRRLRHDPGQLSHYGTPDGSGRRVLIIGPAEMPIPATGWGAVETVISEQIPALVESGFQVTLLNSRRRRLWREASEGVDVVACHYDALASRAVSLARHCGVPLIVTSHYGYAATPDIWEPNYRPIFDSLRKADAMTCLSPAIAEAVIRMGFRGEVFVTPNGSDLAPAIGEHAAGPLILGKVEPRKSQYELARAAIATGSPLTLVGPMHDARVADLLREQPRGPVRWLGTWTRSQLTTRLAEFSALLLPSRGEADALVLYEAQLAGLPIVVSSAGKGSQAEALPWVRVIDGDISGRAAEFLAAAIAPVEHAVVRHVARENYRWTRRITPWADALHAML